MEIKHTLPLLPLRDIVVFPSIVIPLFVGRDKSIIALNESMNNSKKIILATQKNSEVDDPKKTDVFMYGCEGNILQLLKLPDGTVKVLMEGSKRVKILDFIENEKFITCNFSYHNDQLTKNENLLPLAYEITQKAAGLDILKVDWKKVIKRSRDISRRLSKGIEYLMKKNKIEYIPSFGSLIDANTVQLEKKKTISAKKIIIATGGHPKSIPNIKIDGNVVISSKEAMVLDKIPKHLVIIGAGAIGVEFAHMYNAFGSEVTLLEGLPSIVPNEDREISSELERIFKKKRINVKTAAKVKEIKATKTKAKVYVEGMDVLNADKVLMAVGVGGNIKNIGLEKLGIKCDRGFITVNGHMQTTIPNIYAIGDVCGPPLLAHVASFEGTLAAEHLSGHNVEEMTYDNIPGCTYCDPEIASVGLTEKEAKEQGYQIKVGKFPFSALGKALADGDREGFVKIIYDDKYGELLGCHIIGKNATNLITEVSVARKLETTYFEILKTVHPHPTLSEAIHEATAAALNEAIHI